MTRDDVIAPRLAGQGAFANELAEVLEGLDVAGGRGGRGPGRDGGLAVAEVWKWRGGKDPARTEAEITEKAAAADGGSDVGGEHGGCNDAEFLSRRDAAGH